MLPDFDEICIFVGAGHAEFEALKAREAELSA